MNRAQRRGNPVRSRWSGPTGLRLLESDKVRSGVELDTGRMDEQPARPPKLANIRDRDGSGCFAGVHEVFPIDPMPTRQQRRFAARQALKTVSQGVAE